MSAMLPQRDSILSLLADEDSDTAGLVQNQLVSGGAKILDDLRSVLLMIGNTTLRAPDREARSIAQHERILAAVQSGDADEADRATVSHIRSIELDFAAEAERTSADL